MKFRSNNSVSMQLPDLRKAEAFYTGVMGFRLLAKSAAQLEYDTGRFLLCISKGVQSRPPAPTFTVINAATAKEHLLDHGCEIVEEQSGSLSFRDPFGMVYNVTQD